MEKVKIKLNSTQVVVKIEVRVELGDSWHFGISDVYFKTLTATNQQ